MQIGASYSLQFSLVMGCGREPSPHIDTQVRLEFSTNHGLTWHLVKEVRDTSVFSALKSTQTKHNGLLLHLIFGYLFNKRGGEKSFVYLKIHVFEWDYKLVNKILALKILSSGLLFTIKLCGNPPEPVIRT